MEGREKARSAREEGRGKAEGRRENGGRRERREALKRGEMEGKVVDTKGKTG